MATPRTPIRSSPLPALICALLLATVGFTGFATRAAAQDITAEQDAKLKKYLPRTYPKLLKREDVHIVALGDSITEVVTENLGQMPALNSYYGTFAQRLARFFFYTGEVRNMKPRPWEPGKFADDMGPEITFENQGMGGRYINHGMQRVWTDGLEHNPDLVLLNFGVNDATAGMPLWEYIASFKRTVEYIRSKGSDVILLGPSLNLTGENRESMGLTPPFASALEDLAREMDLAYFNLAVPTWTSYFDINGLDALAAVDRTIKTARTLYIGTDGEFDPLHPNPSGQRRMGDYIFEELMDTAPANEDFQIEATFSVDEKSNVEMQYTLTNLTGERRLGFITVLPLGAAQRPDMTDIPRFDLPAGGKAKFTQKLQLWGAGFDPNFSKNYTLLPLHENFVRAPFLVMDDRRSQMLTTKAPRTPLGIIWKPGRADKLTDTASAYALLINETDKELAGSYDASWAGRTAKGEFRIPAKGRQPLQLSFPLDKEKFHHDGKLEVTFKLPGGQVMLERRDLEVVRHLVLGQKVPMHRWISRPDTDPDDPKHQFDFVINADENALTLTAEFSGWVFDAVEGKPMATLSTGFDAQEANKRALHGFYRKTVAGLPNTGTVIEFMDFRVANFGNTYSERLRVEDLTYQFERLPGDKYRVSVTYPRSMFYQHEWKLGSRDSWLGFDLNFTPADAEVFGTFSHENEITWIKNGLAYPDPYSIGVLELTTEPSPYHRSMLE